MIDRERASGELSVDACKRLSLYCYSAGRHEEALESLERVRSAAPDDVELVENCGVLLRLLGRRDEAIEVLLEAHRMDPDRFNVCDALAHSLGAAGRKEEMDRFGRLALELKDRKAAAIEPIRTVPDEAPPRPGERGGRKQVLSFSLWGRKVRYLRGAIRNVQAAYDIYPGWVCRFYCDESVPRAVRDELERRGAEVVLRPTPESFFDGLLWRFEVFDDETVDRFLIRDCDSVVSVQERIAVDDWIESERWFHAMRDFSSHTEVLLAGMWGGVQGVLPPVRELRESFRPDTAPTRTFDQVFLRDCVWPIVRKSVKIHDSVYTGCLGSDPFPPLGRLPKPFHVGQNEAAVRRDVVLDLPEPKLGQQVPLVVLAGLDAAAVDTVTAALCSDGGVRRIGEGSLSDWLDDLAAANRRFAAPRPGDTSDAGEDAVADEAVALLAGLCAREARKGGHAFLLVDDRADLSRTDHLSRALAAKVLSVIRDPRDTAVERGIVDEEAAGKWAEEWAGSIDEIARMSRERPGEAELVRYEDFDGRRIDATRKRLAQFLGIAPDRLEGRGGPEPAVGRASPGPVEKRIEKRAGGWMKRLHYPPRKAAT